LLKATTSVEGGSDGGRFFVRKGGGFPTKTVREWIAYYERHVGKKFRPIWREKFVFDAERGLLGFVFTDDGEALFVAHMIGDGRYWAEVARDLMHRSGRRVVRMMTSRNPDAWMRRYGGRVVDYVLEFDEETYKKGSGGNAETSDV
jgi:hypothetical protein